MADAKHTPGPWQIGSRYGNTKVEIADASYDRAICTVWTHQDEGSTVEFEKRFQPLPCGAANARLIAAAPDLLAALKDLEWALTYFGDFELQYREETRAARAAIAKATGGAQ